MSGLDACVVSVCAVKNALSCNATEIQSMTNEPLDELTRWETNDFRVSASSKIKRSEDTVCALCAYEQHKHSYIVIFLLLMSERFI